MHRSIPLLALVLVSVEAHASAVLQASARLPKLPIIGEPAQDFEAMTTRGPLTFPGDYRGKWVVLFSHPKDFTPVCTSEFIALSELADGLAEINTELVGLSVDSVAHHKRWIDTIEKNITWGGVDEPSIPFPIVADPDGEIAWSYGMIHPKTFSDRTVRAVFVIDPRGIVRAVSYYPPEVGRNTAEIQRLVVALQTAQQHRVATPADWQPGGDVLVPDPKRSRPGKTCQTSYFCTVPLPVSELQLPKS